MQALTLYQCDCCKRRMTRNAPAGPTAAAFRCHLPCARCRGNCRHAIAPVAAKPLKARPKSPAAAVPFVQGRRPPPLFKRADASPIAPIW